MALLLINFFRYQSIKVHLFDRQIYILLLPNLTNPYLSIVVDRYRFPGTRQRPNAPSHYSTMNNQHLISPLCSSPQQQSPGNNTKSHNGSTLGKTKYIQDLRPILLSSASPASLSQDDLTEDWGDPPEMVWMQKFKLLWWHGTRFDRFKWWACICRRLSSSQAWNGKHVVRSNLTRYWENVKVSSGLKVLL